MTTKKFYWFGDSWVFGDELENQVANPSLHTFAHLISQHFQATSVNLSSCGSSIDSIPIEFSKIVNNINPAIDCVFFLLTAAHRVSMFNDAGNFKNILPSDYGKHQTHAYKKEWFKYFDSPMQQVYNYDKTINLLYLWCHHIGVKCYFANIFSTVDTSIIDCVPSSAWLLPKTSCIAEYILPIIDKTKEYTVITEDRPDLTNEQWHLQKSHVEKYIRPGFQHPNIAGHQHIADHLIKLLHERSRV